MPSKQAEAITGAITEVLNDTLENVSKSVVSKAEMQKVSHSFSMSLYWLQLLLQHQAFLPSVIVWVSKLVPGFGCRVN